MYLNSRPGEICLSLGKRQNQSLDMTIYLDGLQEDPERGKECLTFCAQAFLRGPDNLVPCSWKTGLGAEEQALIFLSAFSQKGVFKSTGLLVRQEQDPDFPTLRVRPLDEAQAGPLEDQWPPQFRGYHQSSILPLCLSLIMQRVRWALWLTHCVRASESSPCTQED